MGVREAGAAAGTRTGSTTRRYTAAVIDWTPQPIAFTVGPLAAVMVAEPGTPSPAELA